MPFGAVFTHCSRKSGELSDLKTSDLFAEAGIDVDGDGNVSREALLFFLSGASRQALSTQEIA